MKVTGISVQKFTAFEDIDVEFSPGLNVFIGANATGKSHLMKLMYSYLKAAELPPQSRALAPDDFKADLRKKLDGVFKPEEHQTRRLVRRVAKRSRADVTLRLGSQRCYSFSLSTLGNLKLDGGGLTCAPTKTRSLFVPSRETLAMFEGFVASYQQRELSFDETYNDICIALSATPLRGKRQSAITKLIKPLERILGGPVRLKGNRFYLNNLEAHLLAEGWRKIASLAHLINNGSLMRNSVLFWDEPEANLNPKLVTQVANILRELVKGGVQVFIATHDYLLSHELSLAVEYGTKPNVDTRFFAFSRASEADPVTIESGDTLADLEHNPILEEFVRHYERERGYFAADVQENGVDKP